MLNCSLGQLQFIKPGVQPGLPLEATGETNGASGSSTISGRDRYGAQSRLPADSSGAVNRGEMFRQAGAQGNSEYKDVLAGGKYLQTRPDVRQGSAAPRPNGAPLTAPGPDKAGQGLLVLDSSAHCARVTAHPSINFSNSGFGRSRIRNSNQQGEKSWLHLISSLGDVTRHCCFRNPGGPT
jgi:hypothetical protein